MLLIYHVRSRSNTCLSNCASFFGPSGKSSEWRFPPTVCGSWAEDTVRPFFNCPWCQVHGISFERFTRHWQIVGPGPSRTADSSLAFLKRWGSLPDLPNIRGYPRVKKNPYPWLFWRIVLWIFYLINFQYIDEFLYRDILYSLKLLRYILITLLTANFVLANYEKSKSVLHSNDWSFNDSLYGETMFFLPFQT